MTRSAATLAELSPRRCLCIEPDTPFAEVARLMTRERPSTALVMQGSTVLGVFGARDWLQAISDGTAAATPVRELMSASYGVLAQDSTVAEACRQLLGRGVDELVVTDGQGQPLGLVGAGELLGPLTARPAVETVSPRPAVFEDSAERDPGIQQALIDNFPFLVWLKDADGRFLAVNRPFAEACGRGAPAEVAGKTDLDVWPRELAEAYRADDREVMASGRRQQVEEQIERDGRRDWFETYKTPVFDARGRVRGTLGFARNVTERKLAEQRLQALQRQTDLLSRFAAELIGLPADRVDAALNRVLRDMGELVQADRAYVFRYDFDAGTTSNTHEWCAAGVSPQIDALQGCPLADIPDWVQSHQRGETLIVADVGALPAGGLRDILEPQGIRSLVSLPLVGSKGCFGFVGFDAVRAPREHGPEALEILGLFAKILANHQERLAAERQLADSEANFHAFFDQIQDFLFVLDLQGHILHCNRHVTERLGLALPELVGQSVLQVHPEARRDEAARIVAAMLAGKSDHCPIALQTRSGRLVPVETRVVAGQWNGVPALFGVSRDLSRIAASEEKFSKAFHLSPVAMAISDLEQGVFFEVNAAFSLITGYAADETVGSKSSDMGLFVDAGQRDGIVGQLQRRGQVKGVELQMRTKRGEVVHGLFSAALLELQNRRVMITQMMDITAHKAAEAKLRENEALLRATLNSTADGILVVGQAGEVLSANRQFQTLWNIPDSSMPLSSAAKLADFMARQLVPPADHRAEAGPLDGSDQRTFSTLHFHDGRVFERFTVPLALGPGLGRVWSFRDVSSREHALAALQREKGFLKTLVQTLPHLIWLKDPDGVYLACNPRFEEFFGAKEEEIVGKTDYDFVDRELADFFRKHDRLAMQAGGPSVNEERLNFASNGYEGLFETIKTPMRDDGGALIGVLGIARDISEARRSEAAIREMDRRRKALLDASLDGIAIIDQNHRVIEANARFCAMLGYDADEILTLHTWDFEANFSEAQIRRAFADLTKVDARFESRYRRKDGSEFDVEVSANGRSVQGEPVVITITRDTSERKLAERTIIEANQQFQSVLSSTTDGFWQVDAEGRLAEVNAAYCRYSGYAREDLLGMPVTALEADAEGPTLRRWTEQVVAHGSAVFESRHRRKDGSVWPVEISISYSPAPGGRFFAFVRNTEDRKAAEQERLRMERELQQTRKMEALGQLTGGVAHEFNNMLAIILGHAGLLRTRLGVAPDPRLTGYLDHIDEAGARARDLIRQMLAFSRPQENLPERIALPLAVQNAITLARASLPSSIAIDFRFGAGLPDVRLDTGELQQLLTNLLINARDAMDGKGRVEVGVDLYRDGAEECRHCHSRIEGEWVQLSVADNGTGIAGADLGRIFEPFFTTKTVGKGTGLGLAVVLGIMDRNEGHILVDSAPGVGTRFRLLFPPLARDDAAAARPAGSVRTDPAIVGRVLVVDDEPALTDYLQELLRTRGLEVVVSNDSRAALTLPLNQGRGFDLLITDQTMPGLLGTELVRRLKARLPALKVILCTGHSEQIDPGNAGAWGVDAYLHKPVDPAALWKAIEKLITARGGTTAN